MSHVRIASIALVALALSTLGAAQAPAPSTQPSREQVLERRLRSQEDLIDMLTAQLKAAQLRAAAADRQLAVIERQLTAFQQRSAMPEPDVVPPSWKQQKFNGMAVYLVPCDGTAAHVPSATPALSK